MKRYFEFVDAKSSKFWEVWIDGSTMFTRFGKIGASGQTTAKEFPSADAAQHALTKSIAEKHKKGYRELGEPPRTESANEPRTEALIQGRIAVSTTFDDKVKILGELMSDTSEMFDEVRYVVNGEWKTEENYNVAWALLLSDGRMTDTGFESLQQIRELWNPPDDEYLDSITTRILEEESDEFDGDDPSVAVLSIRDYAIEFLEEHYGPVEREETRGEGFFLCWYRKQKPNSVTKGDAFFYVFVGKSFLVVEVPCAFEDEVEAKSFLEFTSIWGRGKRGQAHTFKNVVSLVLLEEYPDYALGMIDQLVKDAREFEASQLGVELPPNLLPLRKPSLE